ncbi:MAG: hypothetical protein HY671_09380 [Chloroflexi bacterium]|nr:hypothetical protein [Chloroflexota bacterium]
MNRNPVKPVGVILLAVAAILVVLSACGGSTGAARPSAAMPQATDAATPTPKLVPTVSSTPAPDPSQSAVPPSTPAPIPAVSSDSSELVARGKLIFEKTAGGVGCATCHGLDGKGGSAPYIRGALKSRVRQALAGGVPLMSFIKLGDNEITAVIAYLRYLNEQP